MALNQQLPINPGWENCPLFLCPLPAALCPIPTGRRQSTPSAASFCVFKMRNFALKKCTNNKDLTDNEIKPKSFV